MSLKKGTLALALTAALQAPALAQAPTPDVSALDSLLNTPISSAAKYDQTMSEVAGAVTLVTSEDIERFGYRTLADVFAAARGFYVSNDRDYTYLGARGFSRPTDYNDRILLLIDGHITNEGIWGSAQFGTELGVDLSTLERIEIIRGPGSALYGTGAVFAVVNLVTRSGNAIDGVHLATRAGSFGQHGGSLLAGRRFQSGTDVAVSGFWDDADGTDHYYPEFDTPQTNFGMARGHDWEKRWGVMTSVRHGGLSLGGRVSSRRKAIDTAPYETRFNDAGTETLDQHGMLEAKYTRELKSDKRLTVRGYYEGYWYQGDYADSIDTNEGALNDVVGTEASFQWDVASANRLTLGGEYRRSLRAQYFAPRTGARDFDLNVPYGVVSAYAQDEYHLTRSLSLLVGLRGDHYSSVGGAVTPRGALIFSPTRGTTFKLLYGRAYRAPSMYEAEADGSYTVDNPNLKPERASTAEFIYQQRMGARVLWTLSAFNYKVSGLIDPVEIGTTQIQFQNLGSAKASGVEVGLDARLGHRAMGYATYSFQRARDGSGTRLTNSPDHMAKGGLAVTVAPGLNTAAELRYESSRLTVQDTDTDDFIVANLNASFTPRFAGRSALQQSLNRLKLTLRLNNLFDVHYATPGGLEHRQPAIVQDGRNLLAELRYRF